MKYFPTIGLEIHVELKTQAKMFCQCANNFDEASPNVNICPICMGQPGALPAGVNEKAAEQTLKICLALRCSICEAPQFWRKNYFYPDLPKGYQITSQKSPFGERGFVETNEGRVGIHHIHLEEDTARLLHPAGASYSLIDFNRSGVPLLELVSEPDIHSSQQAREFCQKLQLIFRYLGASDADMEKGQMRCEVNISLQSTAHSLQSTDNSLQSTVGRRLSIVDRRLLTVDRLGTKVEIKNLNSFRSVEKAIDYEIKRQGDLLDHGEKIIQETRGWHDAKQITFSQRVKEEAHDYRYFPEPDLPPLDLTSKNSLWVIDDIKRQLPELPEQRLTRLQKEHGLPVGQAEVLVSNYKLGDYFENVISELRAWLKTGIESIVLSGKDLRVEQDASSQTTVNPIRLAANYLITEIPKLLVLYQKNMADLKITPENFAEFIALVCQDKVSSSGAQSLLAEMFLTGGDPSNIIEAKGLAQVSDQSALEQAVLEVIKNNPQPAADYQSGNINVLQFLVGQVMRQTQGQANPKIVQEILKQKLI